jgi:hypothetical protein|tara:strand:- start:172 stop:345 length:174 start_codon:yes stop_codon:yes gene_type:complete
MAMKKDNSKKVMVGTNKDGFSKGGKTIEATDPFTSQTVEVKGTRRMLSSKSKKATWY